jgi:CRISPR-associated protein Cas1
MGIQIMGTLYLCEQNAHLRKTSQRFIVEKDGEHVLELPAIKVDRVVVFGYVQLTTQAIDYLLQQGIETSFLTMHGKLHGHLVPAENKNIFLRLKQYEAYHNDDFRLNFAKELVRSKLKNGRRLLQRLSYSRNLDLTSCLDGMQQCAQQVDRCQSTKSIRGYEGQGTAYYFDGFGKLVNEFEFTGRNRRPPKDPVNSLLSFGYTLLAGEIFSALSAGGLDPYLGFFHEIHYGRASLCFDVCEEFRHLVVDGLVLDVINHQQIRAEDFDQTAEDESILLKPEARKIFLSSFEKKMMEMRSHQGTKQSYRLAIHAQVERLRKAIEGKENYQGYPYT